MIGKYDVSSTLTLVGTVLIIVSTFILAFIGYYLSQCWYYYSGYGLAIAYFIRGISYFHLIYPVLAIVILIGALLANSEKVKAAKIGLTIALVFSIFVFFINILLGISTIRLIPGIFYAQDIGTSGLIDLLGGFIPSTIGMIGAMFCIVGSIAGLMHKPPPSSIPMSKEKVIKPEESITCLKCGAINDTHYKFCSECGTKLPYIPPPKSESLEKIETVKLIVCPVCGKQMSEGHKFCSKCGTPIYGVEQLPPPPPPDIESRIEKLEDRIEKLEEYMRKIVQQKIEEVKEKEDGDEVSIFKD
ncbi:MAG: zinc-ribbon domain-containing protein [Nitrososphaerota archaeon]|nr:zinc-ribbon domain-containing protein [Nitrososphaerota archaeon]